MEPLTYAVKTPEGDTACYSETEVKEVVKKYSDEHGENAAMRDVAVFAMPKRTGTGQRLDVRDFL